MTAEAAFWDRIAARYAKKPVADPAAYARKLEITRGYLRPDMALLEIGCGTGSTALAHAPYVREIRAVDVSEKMLEIARRKAAEAGVANVAFARAALDELEVPDASVDAVLALSVLHLLADRDAAIAKIHAMLKPGGVFVSNTACIADHLRVFELIVPAGRALGLLPLVKVFTTAELLASLTGAGLAIERRWQPRKLEAVFVVARKAA